MIEEISLTDFVNDIKGVSDKSFDPFEAKNANTMCNLHSLLTQYQTKTGDKTTELPVEVVGKYNKIKCKFDKELDETILSDIIGSDDSFEDTIEIANSKTIEITRKKNVADTSIGGRQK